MVCRLVGRMMAVAIAIGTGDCMPSCVFVLLLALAQFGSTNTGELRLTVTDASGSRLQSGVELISEANQFRERLETDAQGTLIAKRLPFGRYSLAVTRDG